MCLFKKKREQEENFFIYLCEEYFKKDHEKNNDYEDIIESSALELIPDAEGIAKLSEELSIEDIRKTCRGIAIKTLLALSLEKDRCFRILQEKFPEDLENLLKNRLKNS